jgi:histone deacetylase 11
MKVAYCPQFCIRINDLGDQQLTHTIELDRPNRVLALLEAKMGSSLEVLAPKSLATYDQLRLVHSSEYLDRIFSSSSAVAQVFEVPQLSELPHSKLLEVIIQPMQWTVAGVSLATSHALATGESVACLGGGYHHAKASSGGGFCMFSDVGVAVASARLEGKLAELDTILYIDTDAHMGNGIADIFLSDPRVKILDIFNARAYPAHHPSSSIVQRRHDYSIPCKPGIEDAEYLQLLESSLKRMLDEHGAKRPGATRPRLAFYNAGSDPLHCDRLGGMGLSYQGLQKRDRLVLESLKYHKIPWVMLPSGGYSASSVDSYADSILDSIKKR